MIKLSRERFKSVLLLSLVILSFILTTRIWFYTSIEGIFIIQKKDALKAESMQTYDKSKLLRPHKFIVNFGEKSTLLLNNKSNYEVYNRMFSEAEKIIRTALVSNGKEDIKKLPIEGLERVRNMKGIDLIFSSPLEAAAVFRLFDIDAENTYVEAKYIDEIVAATSYKKLYIVDGSQKAIFELKTDGVENNLDYSISNMKKLSSAASLFLDKFDPELYGRNVVVPTKNNDKGLPVLSWEKELQVKDGIPESIASFFDDDISSLSVIKNIDGTIMYTDRENRYVRLYTNGMFEYVKYDVQPLGANSVNVTDAIDISTDFISRHFGFPEDCYISDIIRSMQGDKYIIRYKYLHEGLPVVLDSGLNNDTIEIEIVGNEVRRYRRIVRTITGELEFKKVMDFIDVLNILLDEKVKTLSGEKITRVNDMYLAYYESNYQDRITYIPVWVADVNTESVDTGTALIQNKRYIINAETGMILDK